MTTTPPIACTLSPDELRTRRDQLLPGLVDRAEVIERTPEGIRLRFAAAADIISALAQVIDRERQCCRFLSFALTVPPNLAPITLDVSAPTQGRDVLDELVGT